MITMTLACRDQTPSAAAASGFLALLAGDPLAFEEVYCASFELLDATWLQMKASYMEFNQVWCLRHWQTADSMVYLHGCCASVINRFLHLGIQHVICAKDDRLLACQHVLHGSRNERYHSNERYAKLVTINEHTLFCVMHRFCLQVKKNVQSKVRTALASQPKSIQQFRSRLFS